MSGRLDNSSLLFAARGAEKRAAERCFPGRAERALVMFDDAMHRCAESRSAGRMTMAFGLMSRFGEYSVW